ncbi:hypothetical protein E2C01_012689 [Portunus trituberculatus]|uniref:PH domain-containing protein n=1 Tax=Portunus trituberculatus TaxID=210409 RepID=A0A5B7DES4_PORTR|nr:hypothetical protein [Portunus trituberculatus]
MNAPKVASQLEQQTEEILKQHPTLELDIKSSWKRIHFYFMTFEKIAKIVPVDEQDLVQKVVDLLREIYRQGDSGILIDAVNGAPQLNLIAQSDSDKETFILELVQGGNKKNRKYTFRPRQPEAKAAWVTEISRLHLKYENEVERLRKLRSGYH